MSRHISKAIEMMPCDACRALIFPGNDYWFAPFAGIIDCICLECGERRGWQAPAT